jgi:hypothetical protein
MTLVLGAPLVSNRGGWRSLGHRCTRNTELRFRASTIRLTLKNKIIFPYLVRGEKRREGKWTLMQNELVANPPRLFVR